MARAALPGRLTWQLGRVVEKRDETPRCKSIVLELPNWSGHAAGQHVDVRLTAEDGYQAQRSYFVWEQSLGGPLLLIAGGSGIVPFRAMLRHWAAGDHTIPVRLIYSSRSLEEVIYRHELARVGGERAEVHLTLTREWPEDWRGHRGRVGAELLHEIAWPPSRRPLVYVCGPTAFVETVAEAMVGAGHDAKRIRTERFGPTGT